MRNIFILLTMLVALACQAEVITGKVVRVTDGDTITILDADKIQHKVRLAGIDAPEKAQAFGERSRDSLEDLVAGRSVGGSDDQKRRLLYNAVTRAKERCIVLVQAAAHMGLPPFV